YYRVLDISSAVNTATASAACLITGNSTVYQIESGTHTLNAAAATKAIAGPTLSGTVSANRAVDYGERACVEYAASSRGVRMAGCEGLITADSAVYYGHLSERWIPIGDIGNPSSGIKLSCPIADDGNILQQRYTLIVNAATFVQRIKPIGNGNSGN